jgi:hypothetical protein
VCEDFAREVVLDDVQAALVLYSTIDEEYLKAKKIIGKVYFYTNQKKIDYWF